MPFSDIAIHDRGIETPSVIADREDDSVALSHQPDPESRRTGMSVDVGQQFSGGAVQQRLRFRLTDVLEVGNDDYVTASVVLTL